MQEDTKLNLGSFQTESKRYKTGGIRKKEDKSNQHRVVFFWKAKKRIEELAVTTEVALNIQWCKCGARL